MTKQEIHTGVDYRMTLKDAIDEGSLQAKLAKSPGDGLLMIGAEGYSEKTAAEGHGFPIVVEFHEGQFRVLIWSDINQEDPTHTISLEGAREDKRNPEQPE